jgi:RNA polymerase sigma-70 factor (ECF subfamily)
MTPSESVNSGATAQLIDRAAAGDGEAWGSLLNSHRERLRRMVALRLDHRLHGRIDASDVIQDACVDAFRSLPDYVANPVLPFFLWLRYLTGIRLAKLHRHHLGTQMRDAGREVSIDRAAIPETSSFALAAELVGKESRPSEQAMRAELKGRLHDALEAMEPIDREVLALRHFEQLTTAETAQVLGIKEAAAGKRYIRALERLREILTSSLGDTSGILP